MKKVIKLNESDLHKIIKESVNQILKESYNDNSTEQSIINILNNACRESNNDKISLYFSDVDAYSLTKRFLSRFENKHSLDLKDYNINYVARYYANNNQCVLGNLEYGGYGVSFNYQCDLTLEEFYKFFKNFTYDENKGFVRNEVVSYK